MSILSKYGRTKREPDGSQLISCVCFVLVIVDSVDLIGGRLLVLSMLVTCVHMSSLTALLFVLV